MGRRLLTKAPAVNETGEILVNYSADRTGGVQVGRVENIGTDEVCVPFSDDPPLQDRKYLILAFPAEGVSLSKSPVNLAQAYRPPGAGRGDFSGNRYSLPPDLSRYSNRKQFLRGQYLKLACLASIQVCARTIATEPCASLELS